MLDPLEGLDSDGFITTGVARFRVPETFEPLLTDVPTAVGSDDAANGYGLVTGFVSR